MSSTARWYGPSKRERLIAQAESAPNVVTGAYSLSPTDAQGTVEVNSQAPVTVTVPVGSGTAGQTVAVVQTGPGTVTFVAGTGFTLNSVGGFLLTQAQWATAVVRFRSPTSAVLSGQITD